MLYCFFVGWKQRITVYFLCVFSASPCLGLRRDHFSLCIPLLNDDRAAPQELQGQAAIGSGVPKARCCPCLVMKQNRFYLNGEIQAADLLQWFGFVKCKKKKVKTARDLSRLIISYSACKSIKLHKSQGVLG